MAIFAYEVVREPGDTIHGEIEADDERAAAAGLMARGYHILHIEDAEARSAHRLRLGWGLMGGLKRRDLVRFTRELSALLNAGMPLSQCLNHVREQAIDDGWRDLAGGIRARLEDGQTFSGALAGYPLVFDSMFVNLVRAGEEGGELPEVLARLAQLYETREELRSRVKMALVYPCVMLGLGLVTVLVLMTFVVPMFTDVFRETGQALPTPTLMLVSISGFMEMWWWAIVLSIGAGGYFATQFLSTPQGKQALSRFTLRVPHVSTLVRFAEAANFARTLGTLLNNGVPMVQALGVTGDTLRNTVCQDAVGELEAAVRDGMPLSNCLAQHSVFPPILSSVAGVGEESGTLPASLLQAADELERQVDRQVKVLMTLIEPAMIVFVGIVVGFIVLAMLLPVFSLGDTIDV
jgi:type II secretory pathway component PulF